MSVTFTLPSVEAAEKAEAAVLTLYNRARSDDMRDTIIGLANAIRLGINEAESKPMSDLV